MPAPKITLNAAVVNRIRSIPFVEDVVPSYQAQVAIESRGDSQNVNVLSMDSQKLYVIAPTLEFVEGSVILANDRSAIILANDIANPPGENTPFAVLGQTVRLKYTFVDPNTGKHEEESKTFVVRGIMKPTGTPTIDRAIVINRDAGNVLLNKSGRYDSLFVAASSDKYVDPVEQGIRKLYGNDIGITTAKALLTTIRESTAGAIAFISSIALVALLVGAVGIITTLYTSVMERTREIGTMKAIGMQSSTVLVLFLVEALMIGILGATIGLLVGIGGGYILLSAFASRIERLSSITPVFLATDLVTVWMISIGLSMIAGLYPAWRASRLSPMVALRRE